MRRLYKAALALRGVDSPTEVARLLGTTPQVINNWKGRGISKAGLLRAQAVIGCRAEWLQTEKGFMSHLSAQAGADSVFPELSGATGSVADSYNTVRTGSIRTHKLPLIQWAQVGDIGTVSLNSQSITRFMDSPFPSSPGSLLLELASELMAPDYRPGEVIQVDPMIEGRSGDDVIVMMPDGRATFRRLVDGEGGRILQALNPQWPDRLMPFPVDARIVGVVVASWMSRRN